MMLARLDHVVLWVDDPLRSIAFYRDVVGLAAERVAEFEAGTVGFPNVRLGPDCILDLTPKGGAAGTDRLTGTAGSAGHPVNHVCLALDEADFVALEQRLTEHAVAIRGRMENSSGARGAARHSFYFADPDGNVIEARYYP